MKKHPQIFSHSQRLFSDITEESLEVLFRYQDILRKVFPLSKKHYSALPTAIRNLSAMLTWDREGKPPANYLSRMENLAAYAYYFIPWNLLRLSSLFPNLPGLELAEGSQILDLGAGPLTLIQALWIFRPDLRKKHLNFICVDQTLVPLKLGEKLFDCLVEAGGGKESTNWRLELSKSPLHKTLHGKMDFIGALNVLNELKAPGTNKVRSARQGLESSDAFLAKTLLKSLSPEGKLLLVEPGTRKASIGLVRLRKAILRSGGTSVSPCPHDFNCPFPGEGKKAWCHFNLPLQFPLKWLTELSRLAGLDKDRLSLSFLLVKNKKAAPVERGEELAVRVTSGDFPLPSADKGSRGRYGCSAYGKILLVSKAQDNLRPGDLLLFARPNRTERDPLNGALTLDLGESKKQK